MLTSFPAALPDELLYSRLARHHRHTCSTSAKQTLDDLFGDRSVRATIDLQCHLRKLSERMPVGVRETPKTLARATLLGVHTAYQPMRAENAALKAMIDGPASGLHARLGIAAGLRLPPSPLRWCPECRDAAEKRHGEPFWRRSHQIPGVLVCPDHGSLLLNAHLPESIGQHEFIAASDETCPQMSPTHPQRTGSAITSNALLRVARDLTKLLDERPRFADYAALTLHCRTRLISAGLANSSGRLRISRLEEAAENQLAPLMGCYIESARVEWLVAMGRKHRRAFSPLQYVLFDQIVEAEPLMLSHRTVPTQRKFLADEPSFELHLRSAAKTASSLRDAARILNVDPRTVLRHANRLRLAGPWKLSSSKPFGAVTSDREQNVKRRWLEAVKAGGSKNEIRRTMPADWAWLYRHHRVWLKANSPATLPRQAATPRKDWENLDKELALKIKAAAVELIFRVPPARVTQSGIERILGLSGWFGPRLEKLPLCRTCIEAEREGLDDFRLRRIAWAKETINDQGRPPKPWLVKRIAGLPKRVSPRVARALQFDPAP